MNINPFKVYLDLTEFEVIPMPRRPEDPNSNPDPTSKDVGDYELDAESASESDDDELPASPPEKTVATAGASASARPAADEKTQAETGIDPSITTQVQKFPSPPIPPKMKIGGKEQGRYTPEAGAELLNKVREATEAMQAKLVSSNPPTTATASATPAGAAGTASAISPYRQFGRVIQSLNNCNIALDFLRGNNQFTKERGDKIRAERTKLITIYNQYLTNLGLAPISSPFNQSSSVYFYSAAELISEKLVQQEKQKEGKEFLAGTLEHIKDGIKQYEKKESNDISPGDMESISDELNSILKTAQEDRIQAETYLSSLQPSKLNQQQRVRFDGETDSAFLARINTDKKAAAAATTPTVLPKATSVTLTPAVGAALAAGAATRSTSPSTAAEPKAGTTQPESTQRHDPLTLQARNFIHHPHSAVAIPGALSQEQFDKFIDTLNKALEPIHGKQTIIQNRNSSEPNPSALSPSTLTRFNPTGITLTHDVNQRLVINLPSDLKKLDAAVFASIQAGKSINRNEFVLDSDNLQMLEVMARRAVSEGVKISFSETSKQTLSAISKDLTPEAFLEKQKAVLNQNPLPQQISITTAPAPEPDKSKEPTKKGP